MKKEAYIYFLTNRYNNVLYIGVTNNLVRRIAEHKAKINKGFASKYNCDKLVYYEEFNLMTDAIAREKQLKNWKREWKNKLVNDFNSQWKDLSDEIGVDNEYVDAIKVHYREIAGQARNDETTQACHDETTQARNDGTIPPVIAGLTRNLPKQLTQKSGDSGKE
jgi:putative endonuclease